MMVFSGGGSSYDSKVNFVDVNDVFVGYDVEQCCCESADWYIADKVTPYSYNDDEKNEASKTTDVEDYSFIKDFFEEPSSSDLDAGDMAVFKLVAKGKPDLYLHLYNCHNGYYGHGFTVKHSGEVVREGCL